MAVTRTQLNNALIEYLGGGFVPGIIPGGQEERLRAAFPVEAEELLAECIKIIEALDCDEKVLQTGDLAAIGDNASERIKKQFEWLDTLVVKKLGNYYSYAMR